MTNVKSPNVANNFEEYMPTSSNVANSENNCDPETETDCGWLSGACCPIQNGLGFAVRARWRCAPLTLASAPRSATPKQRSTALLGDAVQFHQGRIGFAVRVPTFMAVLLPKMTVLDCK